MKYFCSKCGKTTPYNFELPKFCSSCGQSFASVSKPIETTKKFLEEIKSRKNLIENSNSEEYTPDLNFKKIKAKYKLDVYQSKGETFENIINNPAPASIEKTSYHSENKTKEEILADFQKEAGALRSK
jgi:hypothetical protein